MAKKVYIITLEEIINFLKVVVGILFGLLVTTAVAYMLIFKVMDEFQVLMYIITICNILIVIRLWGVGKRRR